jgi:hypothetical protein
MTISIWQDPIFTFFICQTETLVALDCLRILNSFKIEMSNDLDLINFNLFRPEGSSYILGRRTDLEGELVRFLFISNTSFFDQIRKKLTLKLL